MKIIIKKKSVYGKDLYYPLCENSKIFANLTDSKTLTLYSLQLIKQLGYEIEVEQDKVNI